MIGKHIAAVLHTVLNYNFKACDNDYIRSLSMWLASRYIVSSHWDGYSTVAT